MARCRKQQIHFFLTNDCNLNCEYCYVNKQKDKISKLDINFARCAIREFFSSSKSRWIRLFGEGEPTMEFSLMKQLKDYAHSLAGDELKVELQTNGCFSQEVADWVSKNADIVWISHDGPSANEIQRKTLDNKDSSPVIEKNIRFLAEHDNIVVGIRSTITSRNVNKQKEIVEFFSKMGVKAIASDPVFFKVGSKSHKDIDLMEFAKEFLIAKKRADKLGIFYTTILTTNFDEKTKTACQACLPYPHLTPDGFVSACDMATNGKTPLQDLIYGRYDKKNDRIEYFQHKIRLLQSRNTGNLEKCKDCEVLSNCAGGCLGETLNETGSLFGKREDVCNAVRYLAKNMGLNKGTYPYLHP